MAFLAVEPAEAHFLRTRGEHASGQLIGAAGAGSRLTEDVADWTPDPAPAEAPAQAPLASPSLGFLETTQRGPRPGRSVRPTGTVLRIDEEACRPWVARVHAQGSASRDDLADLIGLCHGDPDPFDLQANLLGVLEDAGIDRCDAVAAPRRPACPHVPVEELAEGVLAACTRATPLPGTGRFAFERGREERFRREIRAARQDLDLILLASDAAVDVILLTVPGVFDGSVEASLITTRPLPVLRTADPACMALLAALATLESWVAAGRPRTGRAWQEARAALAELDLAPLFLRGLIRFLDERGNHSSQAIADALDRRERSIQTLILAHLPVARRFAARRAEPGEDLEDVFQVAFLGLERAAARFDPDRSGSLAGYLSIWMQQRLSRWRMDEGSLVRIPVHRRQRLDRLERAEAEAEVLTGRQATDADLVRALGWTVADVRMLRALPREAVGLEAIEAVPAPEDEGSEDVLIVEGLLDGLPEREADVLRMRFGIGRDDEMTLEEIGTLWGVTRERIRQIEAKALDRLRHPARRKRLQAMLGR